MHHGIVQDMLYPNNKNIHIQVFTCLFFFLLIILISGLYQSFQSDWKFIQIELIRINYGIYMKALQSDWAINLIMNR